MDIIKEQYEVVLIDCPASLGIYTASALITAQEVIVPVIPGQFEIYALALLQQTIKQVQSPRLNPHLSIGAILPIKTDNTTLSRNLDAIFSQVNQYGDGGRDGQSTLLLVEAIRPDPGQPRCLLPPDLYERLFAGEAPGDVLSAWLARAAESAVRSAVDPVLQKPAPTGGYD